MTDSKDVEEIKKAIMNHWHEGHATLDPKYYDGILHDEWKYFSIDQKGQLQIVDKAEFCSWHDPKDPDKRLHWETEFYYVDVTGNVGAAKIRSEGEKVRYIDYFNLLKLADKWWIVHKISHGTKKE